MGDARRRFAYAVGKPGAASPESAFLEIHGDAIYMRVVKRGRVLPFPVVREPTAFDEDYILTTPPLSSSDSIMHLPNRLCSR